MTDTQLVLPAEAEPYVAAVRSLLWALPADERDELLDDLSAHLAELAAEEGPSLRERLGAPSTYAAEFVASAGVESPQSSAPISLPRVRSWFRLSPAMRQRLAALRPAWLVLRPFLILFGGGELLRDGFIGWAGDAELAIVVLAAVASIGLSQRLVGTRDRLATVAGVIGVVVVLGALGNAGERIIYIDNADQFNGLMTRADGTPITNIWAYDTKGKPIDAFLFDQDGQPIVDLSEQGWDRRTGEELHTRMRVDADGRPVPNLFPREQTTVTYDEYGRPTERESRPPRFATPEVADGQGPTTTIAERTTTTMSTTATSTTATSTTEPPASSTTVTAAP